MGGSTNKRIVVQADQGIKTDPITNLTKAIKSGNVAQVVEILSRKPEALSSNPVPPKERKVGRKEGKGG
jgi:hypothetical protein